MGTSVFSNKFNVVRVNKGECFINRSSLNELKKEKVSTNDATIEELDRKQLIEVYKDVCNKKSVNDLIKNETMIKRINEKQAK